MNLNPEQAAAYKQIEKFIESPQMDQMMCLKGYAGTGKTFLISQLMADIQKKHPRWKIAMTAPTNKAVQVLRESSKLQDVTYKTIHSLLGLKEETQDSGEMEFVRDWNEDAMELTRHKIIIIDEVSMLPDQLFFHIRRYNNKTKIIFMGDPAQIPPVGKDDCEPFLNPEEHGIIEIQLTTIMRQADGSAIAAAGNEIRNDLERDGFSFETKSDMTVRNVDRPQDRAAMIDDFMNEFSMQLGTRVIAWTNKKTAEYNRYIRKIMYGENPGRIRSSERMIMEKPFTVTLEDGKSEMLTTNQEIKVINHQICQFNVWESFSVKTYETTIDFIDKTGKNRTSQIPIIHEDGEKYFQDILEHLRSVAIGARLSERKNAWETYWKTRRKISEVAYGYSLTAHKSQGSTYHTTIVDMKNIQMNPRVIERNRILYTSITRAKNNLILIQ